MFLQRLFARRFQKPKKGVKYSEKSTNKVNEEITRIDYGSDESIKAALKEIIIFIIFLLTLTIVANASQHIYMFFFNQTLERSFLERNIETDLGTELNFNDLITTADWWLFMERIFLPYLHGLEHDWTKEEDENDKNNGQQNATEKNGQDQEKGKREIAKIRRIKGNTYENEENNVEESNGLSRIFLRDNILLGPPRLRQIRVKEGACQVHEIFLTYFTNCYAGYTKYRENDTEQYQSSKFYTMSELKVRALVGRLTTYYGAGFVTYLSYDPKENLQIIKNLKKSRWIDRGTRLLIVEFVLFNINTNIFNNVKFLAEVPPVGGIVPSHKFQAIKLYTILTEGDWLLYILGGIFYALVIFYTVEKVVQYKAVTQKQHFFTVWNILDILVLALSYLSLVYNLVHSWHMSELLKRTKTTSQEFVSIDEICYWNLLYIDMIAVCVFLVWIKIFKYLSFNNTMNQFIITLKRCAKDLFGFAVMFFIIFLAYAQLGLIIFGNSHPDFREFKISVISLMRMFLGDFEYQLIEEANPVLGPIFFLTYILFVFFILLNMFLAIINDTYGAVKKEVNTSGSNIGSYLLSLFKKSFSLCYPKKQFRTEKKNSIILKDMEKTSSPSLYPASTDDDFTESSAVSRVQKRESEILREYFEELTEFEQQPGLPKENGDFQRLNKRLILLEEVLEQLINNMDQILQKIESKREKKRS